MMNKIFEDWLMLDEYDPWFVWFMIIFFALASVFLVVGGLFILLVTAPVVFFISLGVITLCAVLATIGKRSIKR
jgi:hypothetical protein